MQERNQVMKTEDVKELIVEFQRAFRTSANEKWNKLTWPYCVISAKLHLPQREVTETNVSTKRTVFVCRKCNVIYNLKVIKAI
jgi:hypothetical protein